jgi:conjugation system TraG family ATPase
MSTPLEKIFPLLEIDRDCIVSKNGDSTVCFQLSKPGLFSLSASDLEAIHQSWSKAIGILSNATVLHVQDWYTATTWKADFTKDKESDFLSRASDLHFNERPYREHRAYCFMTRRAGSAKPPTSALSSLLRPSFVPEFFLESAQLQAFVDECQQFIHILSDGGFFKARKLTTDELTGSPDSPGLIEQYLLLKPPSSLPELQDINLNHGIYIGDKKALLYTLADADLLPAQCSSAGRYDRLSTDSTRFALGFASPLGPLLDVDHIYSQFLLLEDTTTLLKQLERRQRRLQSLSGHARENTATRDTILGYLDEAVAGRLRSAKAHFNVLAWTDNPAELPVIANKVSSAIVRLGATPHLETIGAPQIWWAGIPGNGADFPVNETFDTFVEQAACFLIPESGDRSSLSPFGIRLGERHAGIPLHVDISDEPMTTGRITNRNKAIFGGSGSGKSFFTNNLVHSYHAQGAHIVIVDIGGSYKCLCELLGGIHFAYSEVAPICFNPFWIEDDSTLDIEKKESIKTLLLVLWKRSDEVFLRSEYTALSNALQGYYDYLAIRPELFPCFNTFYDYLLQVFAPMLKREKVKEKDFDVDSFLYVLRPYYKGGEYDYLLNATERLSLLQESFLVFEMDAIKEHPILFPVVTIIIMEIFISKIRKLNGVRKVILLEEAWKVIAREGMAEYTRYLVKTIRKFFGETIIVTQEIEDVVSNPIIKNTIINVSDCKIILDINSLMNRFQQLQDLLGLTEQDKAMVLSLNKDNDPTKKYKEVFIKLGSSHSRVYRTEVSLEAYLVYTTEQRERDKVTAYAARHGGLRKGIAALAADIRSGSVQFLIAALLCGIFLLLPKSRANAQIFDAIDAVVKEALMTADLKLQQLQTQTLLLQNAQKALENTMQQGLLGDITDWVGQQEQLYSGYYQELWQVKTTLTTYTKIKTLISRQVQLVNDYQQALSTVRQDPHFSAAELSYITNVYTGILTESIRNTSQLALVIDQLTTQMDDAGRLLIIDQTGAGIDRNYTDLQRFTQENAQLSLYRSRDDQDRLVIQALYGIH